VVEASRNKHELWHSLTPAVILNRRCMRSFSTCWFVGWPSEIPATAEFVLAAALARRRVLRHLAHLARQSDRHIRTVDAIGGSCLPRTTSLGSIGALRTAPARLRSSRNFEWRPLRVAPARAGTRISATSALRAPRGGLHKPQFSSAQRPLGRLAH